MQVESISEVIKLLIYVGRQNCREKYLQLWLEDMIPFRYRS